MAPALRTRAILHAMLGRQSLPHEEIFERSAEVTVRLPENKPETEREVEINELI